MQTLMSGKKMAVAVWAATALAAAAQYPGAGVQYGPIGDPGPDYGVGNGRTRPATALIGMTVQDTDRRPVGRVQDVVLKTNMQDVEYLAVQLGRTGQRMAVPTYELTLESGGRVLVLASAVETLLRRYGIRDDQWPSSVDRLRSGDFMRRAAQTRRVSRLLGARVRDQGGEPSGTLADLVVNVRERRIDAAIVKMGGFRGGGARFVPVDWQSVEIEPAGRYVTVSLPRRRLEEAGGEYWQQYGFEGDEDWPYSREGGPGRAWRWRRRQERQN